MSAKPAVMENLVDRMERWGYYLLPAPHPHCPGYSGLLVAIRDKPTQRHYDPESIRLDLLTPTGRVESTTLTREVDLDKGKRVCAGTIGLLDRRNKQESFFSFGGTIESIRLPSESVFSLRSSAPILWLTKSGDSVADLLAAEFGHLVAEMRAMCSDSDDAFFRRMALIDPLTLYTASLSSIFAEYESEPSLRESSPALHLALHEEEAWLSETGQWPDSPATIERLLVC